MNFKKLFFLVRYFFSLFIFFITFIYFIAAYGLLHGLHYALLTWSLYILCLPAAHGQLLIGYPLFKISGRCFFIEMFVWSAALLLNIGTYFFDKSLYLQTVPTHFLYQILSISNPYWLIIAISFLGTMYNPMVGCHYFQKKALGNLVMRYVLVLVGFSVFYFISYQEIILLLNSIL